MTTNDKLVRLAGEHEFHECPLSDATHYECNGVIFPYGEYLKLCETLWANGRPRCVGLVLIKSTHTTVTSECKTCHKPIVVDEGTWKHSDGPNDEWSVFCAPEYDWSPLALPCLDDGKF